MAALLQVYDPKAEAVIVLRLPHAIQAVYVQADGTLRSAGLQRLGPRLVRYAGGRPMPHLSNRRAIYMLEVTLRESEPRIWRRVLVPGATTLDRLHEIVQATMLWEGYHLYEFQVGGGEEGAGAARYGVYEPTFADEDQPIDAARMALAAIAPAVGATFVYAYDFGDNWRHDIAVTGIDKPDKRRLYPLCVAGGRAGLPEDCGGVWGYRDLLATLAKGRGEGYDDMLRWMGGDFDPDGFDRNLVNRRLRDVRGDTATG